MRIFTKYMVFKFLGPFLFGLGTFALLVFMGDLFDKMHKIATSAASPGVIVEYLLLQMPYWTIRIVPMATLLAALFSVSGFVRSGEFVAVQSAGFDVGTFFKPLLWISLIIAGVSFIAQETILPASYKRAQHLWRMEIHPERGAHADAIYVVGQDRILTASQFLAQEGRMERVVLDDYITQGLRRQLDASLARWDAGRKIWVFEKGIERIFQAESGEIKEEIPFEVLDTTLSTDPKQMRPHQQSPDTMSFLELRRYVQHLEAMGRPTHREKTGMYAKLAYPFTNLILCALGICVALRLRQANRPFVFASALFLSFFYIWLIELGWYLGKAGRLPPLTATWIANVIFGIISISLYRRINT